MIARLMGLKTISPEDLRRLLEEGKVFTIDVNAPMSWARARVPGAINLDPVAFDMRELPADKGTALVFYCSNPWCRKAPNAARRAISLGYENVRVMAAGIQGWTQKNLPIETGTAS